MDQSIVSCQVELAAAAQRSDSAEAGRSDVRGGSCHVADSDSQAASLQRWGEEVTRFALFQEIFNCSAQT